MRHIVRASLHASSEQGSSWHTIKPRLQLADSSPRLPSLLYHTKNNAGKGTSRLDKDRRFCSNLPLLLSFTGNKQDWPEAKNKLFIWLSQQRELLCNLRLQQPFPEANEISFNSALLEVTLEGGTTQATQIALLAKSCQQMKSCFTINQALLKGDRCILYSHDVPQGKKLKSFSSLFALQILLWPLE